MIKPTLNIEIRRSMPPRQVGFLSWNFEHSVQSKSSWTVETTSVSPEVQEKRLAIRSLSPHSMKQISNSTRYQEHHTETGARQVTCGYESSQKSSCEIVAEIGLIRPTALGNR
jgi:hypothetical protein